MKPKKTPTQKPHPRPGDLLEDWVFELLKKACVPGRFLRYPRVWDAFAKFRIDHKLARKLLAAFARVGKVEESCGHGIKLVPEAEALRRFQEFLVKNPDIFEALKRTRRE